MKLQQLKSLQFLQTSPDWEKCAVDGYTAFKKKDLYILIGRAGFQVLTQEQLPKGNGTVSGLYMFSSWSEDQGLYEALVNDAS